ncbi:MAG: TldD/PmbA family protein [bacterium]|nr:TldD/PmbA family protein [bacterium]
MAEIVSILLSSGGEFADLYFQDMTARQAEAESGRIERIASVRERGVGLRLIRHGVTHFGTSVEMSPAALRELAGSLAAGAGEVKSSGKRKVEGGKGGIELKKRPAGRLPAGEDPSGVPLEQKGKLVLAALRALDGYDSRLVQVKSVYRDSSLVMKVANSDGVYAEDTRYHGVFLVQVVVSDGDHMQTGYEPVGGTGGYDLFRKIDPGEVALISAGRALTMLQAPEAPSGTMPVVLSSEAGGTMVHEAVGHGLEADLAGQELSIYADKMGLQVASPLVTVVDDATLPGRRGSYNYDDEGEPGRRTVLVDKGVLTAFMSDKAALLKYGMPATGNGRRQSFRNWPIPRMSNTIIEPGKHVPADIVRSVDRGLLVLKMGGGQVNTVTGDFVFDVSEGYLIEGGEKAGPVRGATLAGNGPEVLKNIDMVGNDLGFGLGTCGKDGQGVPVGDAQPTLRIPEIVVGGRDAEGGPG